MRIAISSMGQGLDAPVDLRFGRAAGFVIVDDLSAPETSTRYHDNAVQVNAAHGAGVATVQALVDEGVEVVITGQVGPKASEMLRRASIPVYGGASGTVRDALQALAAGTLAVQT